LFHTSGAPYQKRRQTYQEPPSAHLNTMPAPTKRFANHPGAKEAPASALEYRAEEDKNPVVRGLPLVIASTM